MGWLSGRCLSWRGGDAFNIPEKQSTTVLLNSSLVDVPVTNSGRIRAFAASHPYPLLERFAEAVAQLVLDEFPAAWVKVRVAKPAAIPGVRELGVAIERHRPRA